MRDRLLAPDVESLIADGPVAEAAALLDKLHPAEAAELVSGLSPARARALLGPLEPERRADLFCEFPKPFQANLAELMDQTELVALVTRLSPDDRADLLKAIPIERYHQLLPALAKAEREDIKRLVAYPEGTVGSVMTTDYMTLDSGLSVSQAIEQIRIEAPKKESVYYSYIVGSGRHLVGSVSLRDLILAEGPTPVKDIMETPVVSVGAEEDREEAIFKISRFDLLALPVVDAKGSLVGIVTHDDAIDVIEEERTEDMERFMAITGEHADANYLRTPVVTHFRHRVLWLVALAAFDLVSGAVIQGFEHTLTSLMLLAFYMPMLADTGGNTGSQAATVVIRALALKEISPRNGFRVIWKEIRVALLLAAVLGALAFLRVVFFTPAAELPPGMGILNISAAIGLALALQVLSSTVLGAALPLLASRLRADPALLASPALTTIVDITGLLIYFETARLLLGV